VHSEARAQADVARAAEAVTRWASGAPIVLGGDFNVRRPAVPEGFTAALGPGVDHVLARGIRPAGPARALERGALSDHAPVLAVLGG
jgi:endonuclease/exonuclease/phosphatase (EEP) superfamily protein YafD